MDPTACIQGIRQWSLKTHSSSADSECILGILTNQVHTTHLLMHP